MKRLFSFAILSLIALFFIGCKSEEEKALDAAIASRDLTKLRGFYSQYGESMNEKVKAKYDEAFSLLVKDSTLYAAVENANSKLEKYSALKSYIAELPQGVHTDKVNALLPECQDEAESLLAQFDDLRKGFNNYRFREEDQRLFVVYSGTVKGHIRCQDEYEFLGPDDSGKGEVVITEIPSSREFEWTTISTAKTFTASIKRECVGSYYINDDMKIILTVEESRTSHSLKNWGGDNVTDKALLKVLKKEYPSITRKYTLSYRVGQLDGFPFLVGFDSMNEEVFFEPIMK